MEWKGLINCGKWGYLASWALVILFWMGVVCIINHGKPSIQNPRTIESEKQIEIKP